MTTYFMKQTFSLKGRFDIIDKSGDLQYYFDRSFFLYWKRASLCKMDGKMLLQVQQKRRNIFPKFEIFLDNQVIATIERDFSFKSNYTVEGVDFIVRGDALGYNYDVFKGEEIVAHINKKVWSMMGEYKLEVLVENYTEILLCLVLAIDTVIDENA